MSTTGDGMTSGAAATRTPDRLDELVRPDRVHRDLYTDPDIFRQEMRKVFGHAWTYVAHGSEIAEANAFRTSTLGGRPIIVTRDAGGDVHVLLNRCVHRGATVCRVEQGRAKRFVCPYHGWAYANDGRLTGVPWPTGYSGEFDPGRFSLGRAKVAVYRDFVFATFNPSPPTIEEYLGAARPLLDYWIDRFPGGKVVARNNAHRMDCAANWKLVMDNSTDGYHPAFSHRSLLQMAQRLGESKDMAYFAESPDDGDMYCRYLGGGHSFIDQRPMYREPGDYWATQRPQPGREAYEALIRERYPEAEATRLLDLTVGSQMNLTIFPNLMIIGNQIQSLEPVAVDRTLLVWQATTSPELPDEINTLRMRTQEDFPSFGEPDDLANFQECQRGLSIPEVEWVLMNRGHGIEGRQCIDDDGGVTAPATDETPMRGYLHHWKQLMQSPEATVADGVPA
jgi:phenylpropionate dioxygenase-like ring-hydroxylating dioxygenase large terminal subunit